MPEKAVRFVCCWEYARSAPEIRRDAYTWTTTDGRDTLIGWLIRYSVPANTIEFPQAWLASRADLRERTLEWILPPPFRVSPVSEIQSKVDEIIKSAERSQQSGSPVPFSYIRSSIASVLSEMPETSGLNAVPNWPQPLSHLLQINFSMVGPAGAGRALRAWVRETTKGFPKVPTAKAAAIPIDSLKWLSAFRLDEARRNAGVSLDRVLGRR